MTTLYKLFSTLTLLLACMLLPAAAMGQTILDLTGEGNFADHNDARFIQEDASEGAGTGILQPFVRSKSNLDVTAMMNTGNPVVQFETESGPWTTALLLSTITDREIEGFGIYKEFILDINQTAGGRIYPLNDVQVWSDGQTDLNCYNPDPTAVGHSEIGGGQWGACDTASPNLAKPIFWLDRVLGTTFPGQTTGNATVILDYGLESGSGGQTDMTMLVPLSAFPLGADCYYGSTTCTRYVYVYSIFGKVDECAGFSKTVPGSGNKTYFCSGNDDGFEEWSVAVEPFVNIDKTLTGSIDETHDWDLTKDVDATECDQFIGGSCTFNYTVEVTEIESFSATIGGTVTYTVPPTTPGGATSLDANVTVTDDVYTGAGTVVWTDPTCAVGQMFTVAAGGSKVCAYTVTGGEGDAGEQTNTVTVTVEFNDGVIMAVGTGVIGTNFTGPAAVDITDTVEGPLGSGVTSDVTYTYTQGQECSTDPGDYTEGSYSFSITNVAEIVQTGDTDTETVTVNCYAPVVSKTGAGSYDENYDWTIDKSVDPAEHHLFVGDNADSDYDVAVDLTYTENDFKIWGAITVVNPNPSAVMNVAIADVLDDGTTVVLACGGGLEVPADDSAECGYTATPIDRSATENAAAVTFAGVGFPATADISFSVENVNGPPEINVDDSVEGALGSATADHTFEYTNNFECPTNLELYTDGQYDYVVDNTATIVETAGSDSETVTVYCYAPVVSKDGSGQFSRQTSWTISKLATPAELFLFIGDDSDVDFDVDVQKTTTDLGFSVTGIITVVNPAPMAMTVALEDVLDDGTPVELACAGTLEVLANDSATCGYSAVPDDDAATLNTVTATLNAVDVVATADISFEIVLDGYDEVDVTDTVEGPLGSTAISQLFEYMQNFGCPTDLGLYTDGVYTRDEPNTATIVQTDQSADEIVTVNCYAPSISKTVGSELTRTYEWMIEKTVDPASHALFAGDSGESGYTVTVTNSDIVDSNWLVNGTITVNNPHPSASLEVVLADMLSDGTGAALECASPLVVGSLGSADCGYSAEPADGSATSNHVQFSLNGLTFEDTQAFDWEAGTITEVNPVVNLTDDFDDEGPVELGSAAYGDSPVVFEYPRTFECSSEPADYIEGQYAYSKANTAEIVETGASDDASVDVDCYAPVVEKTAETALMRTHLWEIAKSVDPAAWELFNGESGTSAYTVEVTKTGTEDSGWGVMGTITVSNPHPGADMSVSIADMLSTGEDAAVLCGAEDPADATVGAASSLECTYLIDELPNGDLRTNTATATMNEIDFAAEADVDFSTAGVEDINPTVDVTDTYAGALGTISDSQTFNYDRTFECDADEGEYGNTATITQTQQESSADVTVDCYDIEVTKDATASYTRTWDWTIDKLAEPADGGEPVTSLDLVLDDVYSLTYKIEVDLAGAAVDSDWHVAGIITVSNAGNPIAAVINDVSDLAPGAVDGTVDCGVTFPHTIAAGGTLECTYDADLPDASGGLNTATTALQLYDYASDLSTVDAGTRDVNGTADVSIGDPTNLVDECTDVSDEMFGGAIGQVCYTDPLPAVFEFDYDVAATQDDCGEFTIDNTATETEVDSGEIGTAEWSVLVTVTCELGCTYTQGYWKTHNDSFKGGASAKANETWLLIEPAAEQSEFFLSGDTWFGVFNTSPKGNPYYSAAHQWMAAVLNSLSGASTWSDAGDGRTVGEVIADAEDLFEMCTPEDVGKKNESTPGCESEKFGFINSALSAYNEGLIGPGHCGDESNPVLLSKDALLVVELKDGVDEETSAAKGEVDEEAMIDDASQIDSAPAAIEVPSEFAVGNYPNPFNPTTTIQVALPEDSQVRVAVYDILGRMVSLVADGPMSAGTHSVTFDAGSLPSGVYLYRFEWAGGAITRTMQLLK